jgi:hypothetical protein
MQRPVFTAILLPLLCASATAVFATPKQGDTPSIFSRVGISDWPAKAGPSSDAREVPMWTVFGGAMQPVLAATDAEPSDARPADVKPAYVKPAVAEPEAAKSAARVPTIFRKVHALPAALPPLPSHLTAVPHHRLRAGEGGIFIGALY